jgi:hypothetical protein
MGPRLGRAGYSMGSGWPERLATRPDLSIIDFIHASISGFQLIPFAS